MELNEELSAFVKYKRNKYPKVKAKNQKNKSCTTTNGNAKRKSIEKLTPIIVNKEKFVSKNKKMSNAKTDKIGKKLKSKTLSLTKKVKLTPLTMKIDEPSSTDSSLVDEPPFNSIEQGKQMLEWMICPRSLEEFLKNGWEKRPFYVDRDDRDYYKKIISSQEIDKVLRNEFITFTKNIDITSYENGIRETHNPIGRALPHIVWDYYSNGCSIRFLNPQTYIRNVHLLNTILQDYFNCFVGANVYLTPPDSQGFAPHYDDIEAFVLQVEGKKLWKIYNPISNEERLPRFSSKNFDQNEIGNPIMEIELKAGDMLYFPRGFIHQAVTVDGEHSLHITISTYQKNTWADIFEKMIPKALEVAFLNDIEFRKGVPMDLFQHTGLAHFDSESPRRNEIIEHMKKLFTKLCDHLPIDHAVDQFSKNFIHDALPPIIQENERQTTVFGDSDKIVNGEVRDRVEIEPDTKIRLLRANILRLTEEDGAFNVYYTIENSKEYHGNDIQFLEVSEDQAKGVATLIKKYPEFVAVTDLELEDETKAIEVASALWEKGLLATEEPLDFIE